jgi:sialate O-acetylesterase
MRYYGSLNAIVLWIAFAGIAVADVRLPGMFSDSMVLQRDIKLPVWGWAVPGEEVTVEIAGQKVAAKADEVGRWRVTLAPLKADNQAHEMTISGKNKIVIKDVLVGEVWLCSGQSNMAFGVQNGQNAAAELAAANYPRIRRYYTRRSAGAA